MNFIFFERFVHNSIVLAVRPPLPIVVVVELVYLPQKAPLEARRVRSITTVLAAKVLVELAQITQVQRPVVMPKIISV